MNPWQKVSVIIATLTFIRLIIKDIIDLIHNQHKRTKGKKRKKKSAKSPPKTKRKG